MEEDATEDEPKKKGMLVPLVIGVLLAAGGGAGGFWAVTSGPLASAEAPETTGDDYEADAPDLSPVDTAFVELETLVITLGDEAAGRSLLFTAALEVAPQYQECLIQIHCIA